MQKRHPRKLQQRWIGFGGFRRSRNDPPMGSSPLDWVIPVQKDEGRDKELTCGKRNRRRIIKTPVAEK
ncbi:MAG: hypothetical protein A2026_14780 [Deltaproteobacteria bacterium RBG_19FT_COMBO_46_12]|nr:MAG: hypothetical protein A2026_14780 [Deltaproteobacteria bacterium RBG_19FT_COMBO_46_12]